ncbi:MAG: CHAD domain-containing protein, partial [Actinomycetes bacterium]
YSAEAVTIVFGAPAKRLADAFSEVTEILGEHQDACIAQDVLRELARADGIDGRTGFALGLLHEHEFELELHARLEFQRIWPVVARSQKLTKLA